MARPRAWKGGGRSPRPWAAALRALLCVYTPLLLVRTGAALHHPQVRALPRTPTREALRGHAPGTCREAQLPGARR